MSLAQDPSPAGDWPPGTLLHRIRPSARQALLAAGVRARAEPRTVLMRQGDREAHIILLRQGLVKVTVPTVDGKEALLDIRAYGDLVGEMGALNDQPRSATVTTCGPTLLTVIQQAELRTLLAQHPEVAVDLIAVVSERLRWANRRRVDFMSYEPQVRVARILAELVTSYPRRRPEGIEIGIPLTQPELATLAGTSGPSVERALHELRVAGIVATGYRWFLIRDLPSLRSRADLDMNS